jgi:hypothetical protein
MVEIQMDVKPVNISVFMVGNVMNANNVVVQVYANMAKGSHDAKIVEDMLVVIMAFAKIVSYAVVLHTVDMV